MWKTYPESTGGTCKLNTGQPDTKSGSEKLFAVRHACFGPLHNVANRPEIGCEFCEVAIVHALVCVRPSLFWACPRLLLGHNSLSRRAQVSAFYCCRAGMSCALFCYWWRDTAADLNFAAGAQPTQLQSMGEEKKKKKRSFDKNAVCCDQLTDSW